jgi:hypothetical protein
MNYNDCTSGKGSVAETAVMAELSKRGFSVLVPLRSSRYDIVAEKDGKFFKIQVKYVTPKNGVLPVSCYGTTRTSSNPCLVVKYSKEEIDYIAAYDSISEDIYFIGSKHFDGRRVFTLRLEEPKNRQTRLINWAYNFKELK